MMSLIGRGGYCIKSPYYVLAPVAASPVEQDPGPARPRPNGKRRRTAE
jgi:hypothetical protein